VRRYRPTLESLERRCLPSIPGASAVAVGDFTGDGIPDLAVTGYEGNAVSILPGHGDGTFGAPLNFAVGARPMAVAAGDFNGDGKLDLAVANQFGDSVSVLLGNGDGTFRPAVNYAVGMYPTSVTVADVNSDGRPDLVVADSGVFNPQTQQYTSGNVSVLLGKGDGSFQSAAFYLGLLNPVAAAVSDFNGDGSRDLAVANYGTDNVSLLLGNGDGTYQPEVSYGAGPSPMAVAVGDFNGDGSPDLAVANFGAYDPRLQAYTGGGVSVLINNGDGTFAPAVNYAAGAGPTSIAVTDFNHDGHPDLAVADYGSGSVTVLLGQGNGTFVEGFTYAAGPEPNTVAVGDFNGDGTPDLVTADFGGGPGVVLNTVAPPDAHITAAGVKFNVQQGVPALNMRVATFTDPDPGATAGEYTATIAWGDGTSSSGTVTADPGGGFDILGSHTYAQAGTLTALVTVGDTSAWSNRATVSDTATIAAGVPDAPITLTGVAVTASAGVAAPGVRVATFADPDPNGTAGEYTATITWGDGTSSPGVVAADPNGGFDVTGSHTYARPGPGTVGVTVTDAAAATSVGTSAPLTVLAGGFATPIGLAAQAQPSSVAVGDFAGDGIPDLVATNYGSHDASIFLGNGDGTFQAQVPAGARTNPTAVVVGDFNGDGLPDFAISSTQTRSVSLNINNGHGAYIRTVYYFTGSHPVAIAAGDFNGDGKLDLVTANETAGNVSVFLGNGDGTFQAAAAYDIGPGARSVAVGDFNGDGKFDLAVADAAGVGVLLGKGDGTFQRVVQYATHAQPIAVAAGDFNGDGKLDLAVTNYGSNDVSILLGNGDGTFRQAVNVYAGLTPYALAVGDLNGDGRADLALTNQLSGTVSVLFGNGDGTFGSPVGYVTGAQPQSIAIADFNGDGAPDLATADFGDNTVDVLLNTFATNTDPRITAAGVNVTADAGTATGNVRVATFTDPGAGAVAGEYAATIAWGDGTSSPGAIATDPGGGFDVTGSHTYAVAGIDRVAVTIVDTDNPANRAGTAGTAIVATPGGDLPISATGVAVTASSGTPATNVRVATFTDLDPAATAAEYTAAIAWGDGSFSPGTVTADVNGGFDVTGSHTYKKGNYTVAVTITDLYDAAQTAIITTTASVSTLGIVAGGFPTPSRQAYGPQTNAIATGDFNGDGIPDLVVTNFNGNDVSVLLGYGDGTFGSAVNYAVGIGPTSVAVADVNGDGRLDIIVTNQFSDTVSVLLGVGDGTFRNAVSYAVGLSPTGVAVGDFNGDGKPDLAVADNGVFTPQTASDTGGGVSILLNLGNGTLGLAISYAAGINPVAIAVADFNGDGRPDLAVANYGSNNLSILFGQGGGMFKAPVNYATGTAPISVAVGDLNGDGRPDLEVADFGASDPQLLVYPTGTVSILINRGHGAFNAAVNDTVGASPAAVAVGDFNGDGNQDLAVANDFNGNLSVLLGRGDGTFQAAVNYNVFGYLPVDIVVGDFNRDGKVDLATANIEGFGPGSISVVLGNGDGTFRSAVEYNTGIGAFSLVVGDFNGDGKADIVTGNEGNPALGAPGSISVLVGDGDGTFQPARTSYLSFSVKSIRAADLNGDGKLDLMMADFSDLVYVMLGNGDGTFQAPVAYFVGPDTKMVVAGDFNGDGKPDLAVAVAGKNSVAILLGNGNGTFAAPTLFAVGPNPRYLAVADFNGDGKPDLAVANNGSNYLSILLGNGNGTFRSQINVAAADIPEAIDVADLNGDGKLDLVVADYTDKVSVLLGNGNGTFRPATTYHAGQSPKSIVVADFNGDGKLDIAVLDHNGNYVAIMLGKGDGTFRSGIAYSAGENAEEMALGDFNGDGKPDLAFANIGAFQFLGHTFSGGSASVLINEYPARPRATDATPLAAPGSADNPPAVARATPEASGPCADLDAAPGVGPGTPATAAPSPRAVRTSPPRVARVGDRDEFWTAFGPGTLDRVYDWFTPG
jgi:hypothetical protein